jgi:4-alpha-glucanotransferase
VRRRGEISQNEKVDLRRTSGILLHPTSLPGPFGIGDLGPEAGQFLDFLAGAGQRVWQVLPLGPTGYGDSPYQLFSAFAGNPLLISPERLAREGLLSREDLAAPEFSPDFVDYARVIPYKAKLLHKAHAVYRTGPQKELAEFSRRQESWLEDYALFMALKQAYGGETIWTRWDPEIVRREPAAMEEWRQKLAGEIEFQRYIQFEFFRQWESLHQCAAALGIRIMGDVPIYVAHDSADVWAHPQLFQLDENGNPLVVAGVPPDYFSATGQLWGNPIYSWDRIAESGYAWWIERMRSTLHLVDTARLDHFRGFEAYWEVPSGEQNALRGRWVKGPGADLFKALGRELGHLPVVAENLGVITPEVEAIRKAFGFPGMAVLQFAFGTDLQGPDFRPHNYPRDRVAYSGTHDNDTTMGWWTSTGAGDSTRTEKEVLEERNFARRYLATDGREMNWVFIRALMASVADSVLFPLQDVLGLGTEARMNTPATRGGNWRWRYRREMLTADKTARLREMTATYER